MLEDQTCRVVVLLQDLLLETDKRIEPQNFANQNCLLLHKRFYTAQLFKGFRWLVFEILCFDARVAVRLSCVRLGIFFENILFISSNPHSFSFSNWFVYPAWVSQGHIVKLRFSDYMILLMMSWHFALAFKTPSSRPRLQMLDICIYVQYCERSCVMNVMNVLETFCKQLKRDFSKYMSTTQLSRTFYCSSSLNHHQSLLLSKLGSVTWLLLFHNLSELHSLSDSEVEACHISLVKLEEHVFVCIGEWITLFHNVCDGSIWNRKKDSTLWMILAVGVWVCSLKMEDHWVVCVGEWIPLDKAYDGSIWNQRKTKWWNFRTHVCVVGDWFAFNDVWRFHSK